MKARRLLRARRVVDEATAERDAELINLYENTDATMEYLADIFGFTSHQRVQQILRAHRIAAKRR